MRVSKWNKLGVEPQLSTVCTAGIRIENCNLIWPRILFKKLVLRRVPGVLPLWSQINVVKEKTPFKNIQTGFKL